MTLRQKRVETAKQLLKGNENCTCFGRNHLSDNLFEWKNEQVGNSSSQNMILLPVQSDILGVQTTSTVGYYFVTNPRRGTRKIWDSIRIVTNSAQAQRFDTKNIPLHCLIVNILSNHLPGII